MSFLSIPFIVKVYQCGWKGSYDEMKKRWFVPILSVLMMFNMLFAVTPAFAAGQSARAQALAYDRHSIGLVGVSNARELGGYKTKDGRTVKFGKLLRSGELVGMTVSDKMKLTKKYHVVKIVDFRTSFEIGDDNLDPPLPGAEYRNYPFLPFGYMFSTPEGRRLGKNLLHDLITLDRDGDLVVDYYRSNYRSMILSDDGIAMFRGFFRDLLDANGGAVICHCTAGKDRTGNAMALLLSALGVDRKTIIEDYLLTNDYNRDEINDLFEDALEITGSKVIATDVSHAIGVERSWIKESFKTIEANYGSVDNYLKKAIGLSSKDIRKLQKYYLTPAKK